MKCVCGYEGEEFIKSEVKITPQKLGLEAFEFGHKYGATIYACPICGTLKVEKNILDPPAKSDKK
jgi:hypothetical protein